MRCRFCYCRFTDTGTPAKKKNSQREGYIAFAIFRMNSHIDLNLSTLLRLKFVPFLFTTGTNFKRAAPWT